ncbi:hypothetical protein [Acinetobacter sp. CFCC 10889]|uniref:hypothetical protein n=1 Tax=Acinetobacter sp. CFCC 10889 TaxID=1775557 RepID=UPI000DD07F97|nr:hypothetical protein [Acinetobacter sp. CFCC 10889]
MTIDIDEIARTLAACQEYEISALHWDEHHKAALAVALKKYTDEPFKVYRLLRKEQGETLYLLCLASHQTNKACEAEYRKTSFFRRSMPFLLLFSIFLLTAFFAKSKDSFLSATFLISMPFVMGALFEYVRSVSSQRVASIKNVLKTQLWVMLILLIVSVFVLKEGTICVIMASPLLLAALIIGALLMRSVCQYLWKPTKKIYSLALLPLLLIAFLPKQSSDYFGQTQREMIIHAPQTEVFRAINQIGQIKVEEVPDSFIFTMGFPKPIFGMTEQKAEGMVRTIQWERGVKFEEKVLANHSPYLLSWDYQFNKNSFPKGSLDDHVEVGGQYFDLLKTDYQLEKIDDQTTKLILTIDYRVSTEFNWYSKVWINYVLAEFSDVVMTIHKNRLEKS